jgi:hypothetical protein
LQCVQTHFKDNVIFQDYMGVLDIGMFLRHLTDYFVYFGTLCLFLVKKIFILS